MHHRSTFHRFLSTSCLSAAAVALTLGVASGASANPEGGVVAAGAASITSVGNTLSIHQTTDRAVIDWRSFDIAAGERTQFYQPSSSSLAVNRIGSGSPSVIAGQLSANGNIVLVNPNGVMFTSTSVVDVGGLIASSSDISNDSVMAGGHLIFDQPGDPNASIINEGLITVADAGLVGFVAPSVVNNGIIIAWLGMVHLASGDMATMDFYGDGLINLAVSDEVTSQLVTNSGTISASGGTIALTAALGREVVNNVINVEGVLEAQSVGEQDGEIVILSAGTVMHTGEMDVTGAKAGSVSISAKKMANQGTIKADSIAGKGGGISINTAEAYLDSESSRTSATGTGGNGGDIDVIGASGSRGFVSGAYDVSSSTHNGGIAQITAEDGDLKLFGAHVTADGKTGGGTIHIGGEYQGKGILGHALTTGINFATYLSANALETGNGGNVIVWSDETTKFGGHAFAKGGSILGDGGLIELSSKETLLIAGNAETNASAVNGAAGQLLLDPKNITIATGGISGGISSFEFVDPNADVGSFGGSVTALSTGNVVVTDTGDDFAATNAGAVYLFNGATGALISTITGSTASDAIGGAVTRLTNGNFVLRAQNWDNGAFTNAGAVTWGSGVTGISGVVSATNSLVGASASEFIGFNGVTALTNGNYVVASSNSSIGASIGGSVTWGNGTTGTTGVVTTTNSLYGTGFGDQVGNVGIVALANGNYLVRSGAWNNGGILSAGAVTWGNGSTGISGAVSAANSVIGSSDNDQVGFFTVQGLSNSNYLINVITWNNGGTADVGALVWGNGSTGTVGTISAANALIGSTASDGVGNFRVLSNGNYVATTTNWDNGGTANVGAVTWGSGATGVVGNISAANSLIGSTTNDNVGLSGVAALTNGNYVVSSSSWDNGGATNAGAATWGNGLGGTVGAVSAANSLIGSTTNDGVGTVTALTNGNYVVSSASWDNGGIVDAGAATWGNGLGGTVGAISAANSLVGSTASDGVGTVTALTNHNYIVSSNNWDNGAVADAGAVTWGNGTTGIAGTISAANSLVGSTASDAVGNIAIALTNGNYVVASSNWDNGAITNVGAATWGNGLGGTVGAISAANSLVGSTASDGVGNGITALTNGNYVVRSTNWDNGGIVDASAITWGNGLGGTVGAVSAANSLVGSTASDLLGAGGLGVTALTNGNYVVNSANWDNGATVNAGAMTLGNGLGGTVGAITSSNSIIGPSASPGLQAPIIDTVNNRVIARFTTAQRVYSFSDSYATLGSLDSYADQSTSSVTLAPSFITATLNLGTAVTLQASNDITVTDDIIANNASGNGGALTLQAGRSILINADITTDNGDLNLFANERLATGVVNAQRDAGAAEITMGVGAAINTGTGNVSIRLDDGLGKTNLTAGNISLRDITANTILARNINATGDIILNSGALIANAAAGNSITLSSLRNFINNAGAGALSVGGTARWLVYSTNPAGDTLGGLVAGFRRFSCAYASPGTCAFNATLGTTMTLPGTGNGVAYSNTPLLTATPSALAAITYGDAAPSLVGYTYGITGYLGTDSGDDTLGGSLTGSTTYTAGSAAGSYNVNYSAGALTSALGYGFTYANNASAITVNAGAASTISPIPSQVISSVSFIPHFTNVQTVTVPSINLFGLGNASTGIGSIGTFDSVGIFGGNTNPITPASDTTPILIQTITDGYDPANEPIPNPFITISPELRKWLEGKIRI